MALSKLMSDVVFYSGLGVHRTGTEVDRITSDWLEARFLAAGLETRRQNWKLPQYSLNSADVLAGGQHLEAFPLWYSPPTPEEGFSGKLVPVDQARFDPSAIGFVDTPRDGRWWAEFKRDVLDKRLLGAVIAIFADRSPFGLIAAQNVQPEQVGVDQPVPILLVRASDRSVYQQHLAGGDPVVVRLSATVTREATACNVIGVKQAGPEWVVISTPSSGWFRCGGERGPGIALELALAEWTGGADTRFSYFFTANSGHELGFLGARRLHESGLLPSPQKTVAWVHLGASIATPVWRERGGSYVPDREISTGNLQMTDETYRGLLENSFEGVKALQPKVLASPVGELANSAAHGYKGFGLVGGGNIYFHTHEDTPRTVSETSLDGILDALEKTLTLLEDNDRVH